MNLSPNSKILLKWSIGSRILIFILQVISTSLLKQHDANAFKVDLFNDGFMDSFVSVTLSGFANWDSMHYLNIAKNGYINEQSFVFFPFFPMLISIISSYISPTYAGLIIISTTLNNILFVASTFAIYFLSISVLRNKKTALRVAQFYTFNPASIFFSSGYSESLFSYLTFTGLHHLERNEPFLASVLLGCSGLTRSNGIINLGFILFHHYAKLSLIIRSHGSKILSIIKEIIKLIIYSIICASPFIFYQMYTFHKICQKSDAPICESSIYLTYIYLQKKYWNVGFLNYFQIKQIPNFLLATPILFLSISCLVKYFSINRNDLWSFIFTPRSNKRNLIFWNNGRCLPYIIHLSILVICALFFAHVQIATRLICSSSPVLYWSIICSSKKKQRYCKIYFGIYYVLGVILHCSFYPWT